MNDVVSAPCAVLVGDSSFELKQNPFGKDVANLGLFRAIARHAPPGDMAFLSFKRLDDETLSQRLFPEGAPPRRVFGANSFDVPVLRAAGTLMCTRTNLSDLAWFRRRHGDAAYSIAGLIHTLGPPAIREHIGRTITCPSQPWDALICTSPAVETAVRAFWEEWSDYLGARFAGPDRPARRPFPMTPVIPLGVDLAGVEATLSEPGLRARLRRQHGIGDDDAAILWVGRNSFYEKAFPSPMFQAAEAAAKRTARRLHLLVVGWFPGGELHREMYVEAARIHAPSVTVQFLDGNDRALVSGIWAAADIFLSLVDNVQETFGLAPVEAMAAGLPSVVSDWDGYRYTVRHGIDGMRIPTLLPPAGDGWGINTRHVLGMDSYQAAVGITAQHTAVDIAKAGDALAALADDPGLRRRMGDAARAAVKARFDWPAVVARLAELWAEQARIRASAGSHDQGAAGRMRDDPVKGDPFKHFPGFATDVLVPGLMLRAAAMADPAAVFARLQEDRLARAGEQWRADVAAEVLERLRAGGATSLAMLHEAFPGETPARLRMLVAWMCKYGLLEWDAATPVDDS